MIRRWGVSPACVAGPAVCPELSLEVCPEADGNAPRRAAFGGVPQRYETARARVNRAPQTGTGCHRSV